MRLLFVTQVVDRGDAVLGFVPSWIEGLAGHCEALDVLSIEVGDAGGLPGNVKVSSLGRESGRTWAARLGTYMGALRKIRTDCILVHMVPRFVLPAAFLVPGRPPIVLWYTHSGTNLALRAGHALSRKVLTASPESFPLRSTKVVVTGHGIDTEMFVRRGAHVPGRLVTVGRATPSKDLETLLRAVAQLVADGRSVHLEILGGGLNSKDDRYLEQMVVLADDLGLNDVVEFCGVVPYTGIPERVQGADVFLSASQTGSLDKAVLEAMAAGVPAVTMNPSFRSMLEPRGLWSENGQPSDLAAATARVLDLASGEREALGISLREEVVRNHGKERLLERIAAECEVLAS